jgi:hypothetical protein
MCAVFLRAAVGVASESQVEPDILVYAVATIAFGGLPLAPSFLLLNLPTSFLAVAFTGQRLLDAEFLARL